MDLDLSDDQVALRDGIAALLDARFSMARLRAGFDREMFDELAGAGVFSLRADGFSWADCTIVFEQLGRFCVPGPLVSSLLLGHGKIAGLVEPHEHGPVWVEHLDALDDLYVLRGDAVSRVDPRVVAAAPSTWPLDPLTPVARLDAVAEGTAVATDVAEQRARFTSAMNEKERIHAERYPIDEDFLDALARMPPASGIALGFDRLVMLATGAQHIEQVIWAPVTE